MRYLVGAVWAAGIVVPDVLARGWPGARLDGAIYAVAALASLLLWLTAVEAIARLRVGRPRLGWIAIALLALFLPLWVAATAVYHAVLHEPFPPSAVCFFLRNPRYGYALSIGSTTAAQRALIVAGVIAIAAILHALTRRPLPPAQRWLARTRWVGLATVALLLAMPKAARSADLEGMRSTLGGVALFITTKPHLDKPARRHPSRTPIAAQRPNLVVLLQESLGAESWSPWNGRAGASPHVEAMLSADADLSSWFPHAITAAGATAVSVPSLLTGVSPDASGDEFAHAPLLWQEARALGYATALFSAEDYDWMNFRNYFLGAEGPDVVKVASDFGDAPRVNDSGVDDRLVAQAAQSFVDRVPASVPFLVVVQLNATHRPCWAPSTAAGSGVVRERCARAAAYVDEAAAQVIDHLRARGRLESTLVIGTADHGETFRDDRPPRLESYYEDVMRVPLYVRLPLSFAFANPGALAQLHANAAARVSNLDLYPTILDVWGRWPLTDAARPPLAGRSLLRPIDGDRALVAVNTGDIHDFNWSNEGFALYHGPWKWLCDEYRGVRLFDVEHDAAELHDRFADAPPEELARFKRELERRPNLRRILSKIAPELL